MILNSIDKQLKLAEDGQITWQKDLTNPLPGEPVAAIKKGESLLAPTCRLIETPVLDGQDKEAVLKFIQKWLSRYIQEALEPLFKLKETDIAEGAPREIAQKLFEALGILPRAELENLIGKMDEEKRASLRSKKIRFGPLLVFLPELNKPAAVRLRALLLTLWRDKTLPADVPADGIVSFSVAGKEIDADYYRSIGYPVYGPRSVRVDMLDRVICAVYDGAKDGMFMAQHQMAEWLGSNIADLYAVLEAMGHIKMPCPQAEGHVKMPCLQAEGHVKMPCLQAEGHVKISDPADAVKVGTESEAEAEAEAQSEPAPEVEKPATEVKPELATFRLKKGKAIDANKPAHALDKKVFKSDKKKLKSKGKKSAEKKAPRQNIYKAEVEAKPEDSPFAILQQLKVSNKDKS